MPSCIKDFDAQQKQENHRWRMIERNDRPYIYVRDTFNRSTRISLAPKRKDVYADCKIVWTQIEFIGQKDWEDNFIAENKINAWTEDANAIQEFFKRKNKGSTNKNYLSLFKQLCEKEIPQTYKSISQWMLEKDIGTKPFQTRLEFLRQLQDFCRTRSGRYPAWFTDEQYQALRSLHNDQKKQKGKYQSAKDLTATRGIVSKEEAEQYLDANITEFPFQCWAIAMMMCYGLRNHELWYMKRLKNLFIEIPGTLTKSKTTRIVWPAFASWDKRYGLFENFTKYQSLLRRKRKPRIKSMTVADRTYSINDEEIYFDGIGDNNDELGEFLTRNTLGVNYENTRSHLLKGGMKEYGRNGKIENGMPALLVKSPIKRSRKKIPVKPYDLRHTWAVFMHTDPHFRSMKSADECAEAMGHGLAVHKSKYLLWLNKDEMNKATIESHQHPYAD